MQQPIDPVSVAILIAGILVSPQLAEVIGPYAIIAIAASTGAAWSLGRHESTTRLAAAGYMVKINLTALLLTVGIAEFVGWMWPSFQGHKWILAPIALMVGAIGNDWPNVGRWLSSRLATIVDRRVGGQ